jgi:septal ring factor EnvC (AmiA/AmiB activator)
MSDLELLGVTVGEPSNRRQLMLRRARVRRDAAGEVVRNEVPAFLSRLSKGSRPPENIDAIKAEAANLREQLAERDRQLAEWQTCHESVERELKRASERAAALQAKINATSNELAQARTELAKARVEAEANRKANEALNRQLQVILKASKGNPTPVTPPVRPPTKRKPGHKPPGELAA